MVLLTVEHKRCSMNLAESATENGFHSKFQEKRERFSNSQRETFSLDLSAPRTLRSSPFANSEASSRPRWSLKPRRPKPGASKSVCGAANPHHVPADHECRRNDPHETKESQKFLEAIRAVFWRLGRIFRPDLARQMLYNIVFINTGIDTKEPS